MKRTRPLLSLGVASLLIVLSLATGCQRPASPNVTPTPVGGAQALPSEETTPDPTAVAATAMAHSAEATQAAQTTEPTPTPEATTPAPPPTSPPATEFPTPLPTTPPLVATTPAPSPTSPPTTGMTTHVVQRGENLFRIALRYGTTVQSIASANGIANPALIYVGQTLTIPASGTQPAPQPGGETTYVVKAGDNLFRIALRYNLSYLQLAQYNGIANPSRIYVGQVLRIPPH